METEEKREDFIRKLMRQQPLEKAPEGFTDRVMQKISPGDEKAHEPIFSPVIWFVIFLGAAAVIVTMLFLDIPLINNIFSSSGIQQISFNIFSDRLYESFLSIFQGVQVNTTVVIILVAFVSLIVIERVLANRRSSQGLILL
jgi:hypothetical protein